MVLTRTFMANVRSSQIKIKASEFPAFLYADASKFDPKKPHRGLLKGLLLVRVSDVASTSSCVSLRKLRCIGFPWYLYRPKHCNAKGCAEYFEVTGRDSQDFYRRTIRNCYAAVLVSYFFYCYLWVLHYIQQTRQALSSTQWSVKDLHFDYRVFTDQLLSLFKDPKNPWVRNLLDWWNKCVIYYAD